tara:strand:- start:3382 stop:3594 length:213 start_codon:yes stop_codon:yes gene_type:complete
MAIPNRINCANFCNPKSTALAGGAPTDPILTAGATGVALRVPALADSVLAAVGLCGLDGALAMFIGLTYN